MTPEQLAEIEADDVTLWTEERKAAVCAALRAAQTERDTMRAAVTAFAGVLATDSGTVLSRRVREAVDALVAVATGETPVVKEETR